MKWRRLSFEGKAAAVFFLCLTLLTVTPLLGGHEDYGIYNDALRAIMAGADPYAPATETVPASLTFRMAPAFAPVFLPFSSLGSGAALWIVLNLGCFLAGFLGLMKALDEEDLLLRRWWFVALLLLMANEMAESLGRGHSGGFITGGMMLAMALYMRGRERWAALLLAMGAAAKIYPLAPVLLFGFDLSRRFVPLFILYTAGFLLLPLLIVPSGGYVPLMQDWWRTLVASPLDPASYGLEASLLHFGFAINHVEFILFMLGNIGGLAMASFFLLRKDRPSFIRLIAPAVLGFTVLFNPFAGPHTFITAAPVFGFMLHAALHARNEGDGHGYRANLAFLAMSWFLVSGAGGLMAPGSLHAFAAAWRLKTLGSLLLYLWAWAQIVIHFSNKMQAEGTVIPVAGTMR